MLANLTGIMELALEEEESKSLSDGMAQVMRHYNISFIDDKTTDWINLGQVMFGIYASRIMAHRLRRTSEREAEALKRSEKAAETTRNPQAPSAPARQATVVHQPGLPAVAVQ